MGLADEEALLVIDCIVVDVVVVDVVSTACNVDETLGVGSDEVDRIEIDVTGMISTSEIGFEITAVVVIEGVMGDNSDEVVTDVIEIPEVTEDDSKVGVSKVVKKVEEFETEFEA